MVWYLQTRGHDNGISRMGMKMQKKHAKRLKQMANSSMHSKPISCCTCTATIMQFMQFDIQFWLFVLDGLWKHLWGRQLSRGGGGGLWELCCARFCVLSTSMIHEDRTSPTQIYWECSFGCWLPVLIWIRSCLIFWHLPLSTQLSV